MLKKFCFFLFSFSFLLGCGSGKIKLEDNPLVEFKEAFYSKWSSGIKGGGSGFNIRLSVADKITVDEKLVGIYFKERFAKLKFNEPNVYTAFVRITKAEESNLDVINTTSNSKNDLENMKPDFPIALNKNEAVLVYVIKEKKKYFKITLEERNLGIAR